MNTKRILAFAIIVGLMALPGCKKPKKDYTRPLEPGQLALRKITDPARVPDFTNACHDLNRLSESIDNSLSYLAKPSSKHFFPYADITHNHAVKSLQAFKGLLKAGLHGNALNQAIRQKFDVYESIGCDDNGTVLFTGYYTPIFKGSLQKDATYQYPLYKQPADLEKGPNGEIMGRRLPDGSLSQYPPRAQLENSNLLDGLELVYLTDPFEVYVAHVQGSCRIRLGNGDLMDVGYIAGNGQPYHSIAHDLIKEGAIPAEKLSLSTLIDFFKNNPDKIKTYTQRNPRFVFFHQTSGNPHGSLNEPVTELRSIATDKSIYPRACLAFVDSKLPRYLGGETKIIPQKIFALDQDTGGAIRAPGRCDIYMGIGPQAGKIAGMTYQEGKLYYLFLKD